jgi:hypothetical protein
MLNSPNMGLIQWQNLNDYFSNAQLSANWSLVDQHDHSSGKGVQVNTAGIAPHAITNALLASGSVSNSTIAPGAVNATSIANNSITSTQIQPGGITSQSLSSFTSFTPLAHYQGVVTNPFNPSASIFDFYTIAGTANYQIFANGLVSYYTNFTTIDPLLPIVSGIDIIPSGTIASNSTGGTTRIDQIVAIGASYSGGFGSIQYVEGTPSSVADLTNRTGAVSDSILDTTYSTGWMRIVDIMVPNGATQWGPYNSSSFLSYTDRRPWALGGFATTTSTTVVSGTLTQSGILPSNGGIRMELGGTSYSTQNVKLSLQGFYSFVQNPLGADVKVFFTANGNIIGSPQYITYFDAQPATAFESALNYEVVVNLNPGSYFFQPWLESRGGQGFFIGGAPGNPIPTTFTVQEMPPSNNNGTQ